MDDDVRTTTVSSDSIDDTLVGEEEGESVTWQYLFKSSDTAVEKGSKSLGGSVDSSIDSALICVDLSITETCRVSRTIRFADRKSSHEKPSSLLSSSDGTIIAEDADCTWKVAGWTRQVNDGEVTASTPKKVQFALDANKRPASQIDLSSSDTEPAQNNKKGFRFWIIFISLMAVAALSAIDMSIISTTLPTIVNDLPSSTVSSTWVTSAFLLTTTVFMPFMGSLADVIGRRDSMIVSVVIFLGGSVVAALSKTMLVLVVGRAIQGVGGGGIQAICEIIMSDLTSLKERGLYISLISTVFAASSLAAPVLGGLFSQHNWRWIFWINLPIGGAALALIIPCMKLKTLQMPLRVKIHKMDLVANMVLLVATTALLFGVTEGGIVYAWSDWHIVLALVGGSVGLLFFFALEFIPNRLARDPVLPLKLFRNRTSTACFVMAFLHGLIAAGELYNLPLYFQAIKNASPLKSAIDTFAATAPGPVSAILAGVLMVKTGRYMGQICVWWALTAVGCGLLSLLKIDTPVWEWVLVQLVAGFGIGGLFAVILAPIQASLPLEEMTHATAAFTFCRSFGSMWGVALGSNVFIGIVNTQLKQIPGTEDIGLRGSTAMGFATLMKNLPPPLLEPVREAYQYAINRTFIAFIPIAVLSFLISFLVKEFPLPDFTNAERGIDDCPAVDMEKSQSR
ncbi:hypothetical protein CBS101457_002900 [Exobasidium rhododendri]|nr:hypothetical protein CBS101457_002900 [Exobasidium rhododendri]